MQRSSPRASGGSRSSCDSLRRKSILSGCFVWATSYADPASMIPFGTFPTANAYAMLPTKPFGATRKHGRRRIEFTKTTTTFTSSSSTTTTTCLGIMAPPGSGYLSQDDETSELPTTYEPMMEYPGTMRPGRTPENIPYQDLPIGDDDPDPVPWPHFQEIEWHHRWDPPHPHPTPMELFIEQQGRWATPELEAEMRAGVRRGIREKKEAEEAGRRGTIITDDDEDDDRDEDDNMDPDASVALGDGIFGQLGSTADQAATAAAVDPKNQKKTEIYDDDDDDDEDKDSDDNSSLDDFLFDLGLDSDIEDDDDDDDDDSGPSNKNKKKDSSSPRAVAKSLRDLDGSDDDDDETSAAVPSSSQTIHVEEDDDDLDFVDDDDGDMVGEASSSGGGAVPLDDFGGGEDDDGLGEDIFDEGGFDFDDDFDDDGGDMW